MDMPSIFVFRDKPVISAIPKNIELYIIWSLSTENC